MANFYDVAVHWKDKSVSEGRGIGNNAAWLCQCRRVLLGPLEDLYQMPPCPCGKKFRIVRGQRPRFVAKVIET